MSAVSSIAPAILACLLAVASAAEPPATSPEALPPQQAADTMVVPDGFHLTLCAAEPDLVQPIAMCLDDRGRVWVAEAYSYPNHHDDTQHDRILIFEDTNRDGRFDRRTVFYDKLNYVTGIEVGFGGLWVMSPPYFFFIPDRDGDDLPDADPEVVLDGFGNHANSHNLANGLAWGPDGWLYNTHGRTNWSLIGKPGTPEAERLRFDGGVWRYHPVRKVWESFVDGCTNPWGIDWNDYGQAFIPNTVDPHLFHAIPGAHFEPWRNRESSRFAYQRLATIADHLHFLGKGNVRDELGTAAELAAGGGHSHCGLLVYLGDNWPDRYRNSIFLHNTHGKRINNDVPQRKGSGYTAHHAPDLLISPDPWFMGVSFATAPDGAVYFTDWSDTGECHSTRNTRRGTGRLFRLSYGQPAAQPVDLAACSNDELVQLQLHRNDWQVRHARRILQERAATGQDLSGVHTQLHAMFTDNPDFTRKLRALWALVVSGGTGDAFLTSLLEHESEDIRYWAITLLCENRDPPKPALARFSDLARTDPSALVRLALASTLQRLPPASRWEIAEALLGRAEDRDDQNLPLMIWYGIEPLVHEDIPRFAGLLAHSRLPLVRRHLARRIASLPEPAPGLAAVLEYLTDHSDLETVEGLLTGLQGRDEIAAPANWPSAAEALSKVPALVARVAELGARFGAAGTVAPLRLLAADKNASEPDRLRALAGLLDSGAKDLAPWLLRQLADPVLQRPVLRGLARYDHPDLAPRLLSLYSSWPDLDTRRDALQSLAVRPATAAALLDAVEAGRIPRDDLNAYLVRQIHSLGDPTLNKRLAAMWGTVRDTPQEKRERIDRHLHDLRQPLPQGDPARGRLLYRQLCAACHKLFDEGADLGPDLTGAQRDSLDYLLENIIDPSGSVPNEYRMQVIETTDGRILTGFLSAETETTLTLQMPNEAVVTPRSAIKNQIESPLSIMPDGLLDALSETQLRDLVRYLMSPQQVAVP